MPILKILSTNKTWKGHTRGVFTITNDDIDQAISYFKTRNLSLPINIEHQQTNGAVGWITDLFKKNDGLYGKFEWTPEGEKLVKGKTFKYLSPEIAFNTTDPSSGNKVSFELIGAAVTVRPFMDDLDELKASRIDDELTTYHFSLDLEVENSHNLIIEGGGISVMDIKQIIETLELPETSTPEEVMAVIETLIVSAKKLKDILGDGEVVEEQEAEMTKTPVEEEKKEEVIENSRAIEAENKAKDLESQVLELKAEKFILSNTNKIQPSLREEVKKQYILNPDFIEKFYENSKAIINSDNIEISTVKKDEKIALTKQQKEIANSLGVSEESYALQLNNIIKH